MDEIAKKISDITKNSDRLIYYPPEEVQKNFEKDQIVFFQEGEELAAFGLWDYYGDWVEIHTGYVAPEFRGMGYGRKLLEEMKKKLEARDRGKNFLLFTRAPQIAHLVSEFGFKKAAFWKLPLNVWLKIIFSRLSLKKLPTYIKHGLNIFAALNSRLFILKR